MLELPYGIADFHAIRRDGMVYVDRTAHLRDVERLGRTLMPWRSAGNRVMTGPSQCIAPNWD